MSLHIFSKQTKIDFVGMRHYAYGLSALLILVGLITIFMYRLEETLKNALALLGPREVCIARELTKTHEEYLRFRLEELPDLSGILGEVTVLVGPPEGNARSSRDDILALIREELPLGGAPRAVARRVQSRARGWTTGEIYALISGMKH